MRSNPLLSTTDQRTYDTIFRHPVTHNLEWRLVRALLDHVAEMKQEPNGNLHFSRDGHSLVLHAQHTKDIAELDQVMALRHFLKQSEAREDASSESSGHCLVVVDHQETRIFRSDMAGGMPQKLFPHEPAYFRNVHHSEKFSWGQEKPDPNSYFAPVAQALEQATQILIFGTGTGSGSEMEQFIEWLKSNHPELSRRVVGSLKVDEHHSTEAQLLAKAREFYATAVGSQI